MTFELSLLDSIQVHLRCGFLDVVMPIVTSLGNGGAVWIACSIMLLLMPRTRGAGAAMALAIALEALCCNVLLKPLVARPRPCDVNTTVRLLVDRPQDFSFPSGHAGASFAAASALLFTKNRLGIPAAMLAVLIGFSRLYLYVHFPSDVLAGALIGIITGWMGYALTGFLGQKRKEHKAAV